jgi:hypothetical protein
MATKKSDMDSKRNTYVHGLAFKWLVENRPDVIEACRAAGLKKYPKSGQSRSQVVLTDELKSLK